MKFTIAKVSIILLLVAVLCLGGCAEELEGNNQAGTVSKYNSGAFLTIEGDSANSKYYEIIADAWSEANKISDKNVTVTLYQDWEASDGSFGSGDGFNTAGTISPVKRNSTLTLDLNNHKVNRNLSSPAKQAIFDITNNVNLTVKNGDISGGYNDSNGGAILFNNDSAVLNLINIKIHDNHSSGNGGGVFFGACNGSATLKDCKIFNNISDGCGGGVYFEISSVSPPSLNHFSTKLTLINKVEVKDNHGKNDIDDNFLISGKNLFVRINAKKIDKKSNIVVKILNDDKMKPIAEISKDDQVKAFASEDNNYFASKFDSSSGKFVCLNSK